MRESYSPMTDGDDETSTNVYYFIVESFFSLVFAVCDLDFIVANGQ